MKFIIPILFIFVITSYSQQLPSSFSYLKTFEVDKNFAYVHFNEKISTILNEKRTIEEVGIEIIYAIKTKIDASQKENYIIEYDPGPSADPSFTIYKQEMDSLIEVGYMLGTNIFIPGNGSVYVSGHTNNMYDKRRKFVLNEEGIHEIRQSFYFVGIASESSRDIILYSDIQLTEEIAKLPKDSKLTVLINKDDLYLIKTSFGLTGWMRIPEDMRGYGPIKDLYYAGD